MIILKTIDLMRSIRVLSITSKSFAAVLSEQFVFPKAMKDNLK